MSSIPLSQQPAEPMSRIGWQGRLDEASTPHEVVDVSRDFLASWSLEEIVTMPAASRPWKIVDADDVNSYAIQLAQAHCATGAASAPLDRMAAFFSNASLRITQMLARSSEEAAEEQ
jgi:hypothetical protein